ncbi:MAG: GntR family transcriptional regulator [Verrucomicrobiae bacterium]|nr:GntR family transcriptional regulator [Verrucomicrobiae bacterium]
MSPTRQIQRFIRQLIIDEKLVPGQKLPSVRELAMRWGTHPPTVYSALQASVREGHLECHTRRGFYVAEQGIPLRDVGIYYSDEAWLGREVVYPGVYYRVLKEELDRRNLRVQLWIDPRSKDERRHPWPRLVDACRNREVQAVISRGGTRNEFDWLSKLPVPVALETLEWFSNGVAYDMEDFIRRGLKALAAQGCRSVGLITLATLNEENDSDRRRERAGFPRLFLEMACAAGFTAQEEWCQAMAKDGEDEKSLCWHENFGRDRFLAIWNNPQRPAGLMVYPSSIVPGVLRAITETQVSVPANLKLAFHRSQEVDMESPFPITWLFTSDHEKSGALIDQIQRQQRGDPPRRILVPFFEGKAAGRAGENFHYLEKGIVKLSELGCKNEINEKLRPKRFLTSKDGWAFTLTELLVVLCVIFMLAAFLLPALKRARGMARQIQCLNNLKQLSISCLEYAQDNDDNLPPWRSSTSSPRPTWSMLVAPYVKTPLEPWLGANSIFACPSDVSGVAAWIKTNNHFGKLSYAANLELMDNCSSDSNADGRTGSVKIATAQNASATILFAENHNVD